MTPGERRAAVDELYELLDRQGAAVGGPRLLATCTGRDAWPDHGVYFFYEPGELREDGQTPRIVRIGTHGLTATSQSTLWKRLRTHRGAVAGGNPGGGNHRSSVFRLHVGAAIIDRDGSHAAAPAWGRGVTASRAERERESELERQVSHHLGRMRVLWVAVADAAERRQVERDCIALLSNSGRIAVDPHSPGWLGRHSPRPAIRDSGLWNVNHVEDQPTMRALALLRRVVPPG